MAMTIPHGGQRPPINPKGQPAHPQAPRPHAPHPHKHAAPKPKGGAGKAMLIIGALLLAAAGAWIAFGDKGDGLTSEERLLKQMHDAAAGMVVSPHTFNGELTVVRGDQGLNVVATNLPSKACVSVAWRLAREGTVVINGTMPMRVSAGKLTELCSEQEGGATLTWVPGAQ
jgi:hypothetical protein